MEAGGKFEYEVSYPKVSVFLIILMCLQIDDK